MAKLPDLTALGERDPRASGTMPSFSGDRSMSTAATALLFAVLVVLAVRRSDLCSSEQINAPLRSCRSW